MLIFILSYGKYSWNYGLECAGYDVEKQTLPKPKGDVTLWKRCLEGSHKKRHIDIMEDNVYLDRLHKEITAID